MAYDIISIGDGEILANTFQGAAMIFGGGSLNKLIISGFIMGIMGVCVGYLINLEFRLYQVIVGLVVYLIMFVPKDTVFIEDLYTGEVRSVGNVPIGVAVPMSIISSVGIQTTILFESVFSTPDQAHLIDNGYLDSLKVLMSLRNMGIGSAGSNAAVDGDVGRTIRDYVNNCVALDVEMSNNPRQEVSREKLLKATDLLAAMQVSFVNIDILMNLPTSLPNQQNSCKTAYQMISAYLTGNQFNAQLDRHAKGLLHINDPNVSAADRIDNAANALNLAGLDAQTYMRNAVLKSYLTEGPSALITRSAKEQLNLQWASEQSMFNQIEKPLMAFVEMFVVAISPIVAFLTTFGAFGLQMMVRYLQLIAWISLWGPLMAVCNLFITIVTTRALASIETQGQLNGTGLDSMAMHDQFYQTIEVWLSTGAMLAASVPALALMIVYGGSVAATNLSGRMTSGASSSIKPERVMPEVVSMAPVHNIGSFTEGSKSGGFKKTGMAETMNDWGYQFSQQSQSSRSSLVKASQSAAEIASQMNQHSTGFGTVDSKTSTIMNGVSEIARTGSSYQTSDGRTHNFSQKSSETINEQVQAAVNTGAKLGLGAELIGAGVQANLIHYNGMNADSAKEWGDLAAHVATKTLSGGNESVSTSANTNQTSNQAFERDEHMSALAKQYQAQIGKVREASNSYSIASALQQNYGTSLKEGDASFAQRLYNSGAHSAIARALNERDHDVPADQKAELSKAVYKQMNSSNLAEGFAYTQAGQTLGEFKKLQYYDPAAAMKIYHDYLMPAVGQMDTEGLKHDSNKANALNADQIMSDDRANAIIHKSSGESSGQRPFDTSGYQDRSGSGNSSFEANPKSRTSDDPQDVGYSRSSDRAGLPVAGSDQSNSDGYQATFELSGSQANQLLDKGAGYVPYNVEGFNGKTKNVGIVQLSDQEAAQNPVFAGFDNGQVQMKTNTGTLTKPVVIMELPEDQAEGMLNENTPAPVTNGQVSGPQWYENIEQGKPVTGDASSLQGGRYQGVSDYYGHLKEQHKTPSATNVGNVGVSEKQNRTNTPDTGHDSGVGRSDASIKTTVDQEIGIGVNSTDVDKNIANGGHLDRSKINGAEMLYKAGNNHPVTVGVDKVVDYVTGSDFTHGKKDHPIINDVKNTWNQSVDAFKEIIDEKKSMHDNDKPSIPSDNDLPPIKDK